MRNEGKEERKTEEVRELPRCKTRVGWLVPSARMLISWGSSSGGGGRAVCLDNGNVKGSSLLQE